jgi:tetratricopeptide (TPR) repeat protein
MADRDQEARLRDLKKRVEREPSSRVFVPLAEEYRKAGRLSESIQALEDGLAAHPGYVGARVALARAFLEVGRIDESMAAFSQVLVDDPSNLVAAKALGDIHLSRGEPMEALKRYLRFRAVSGDRRLDEVIAKLREETAPAPDAAPAPPLAPPALASPAPIEPVEAPTPPPLMVSPLPAIDLWPAPLPRRDTDPFDITSVPYARSPKPGPTVAEPAESMLSRDVRLDGIPSRRASDDEEIVTRKIRLPEATWPFEPALERPWLPEAAVTPEATAPAEPGAAEASGRTLAELYLEQGHLDEALRVADELLLSSPGDEVLQRLRDDAADRLAVSAPATVPPPVEDSGRERRLAKIRLLNQWLAAIGERSRP